MKLCSCMVRPWVSVKCLLNGYDEVVKNKQQRLRRS